LNKYVLVAAIVISSLLIVIYYATSNVSPLTVDMSHVEGPSPSYLTDRRGNEMKIFLASTDNLRIDFCNWNYNAGGGIEVQKGDSCFIVNVTVRNDYTDPIWTDADTPPDLYNNHVKLTAYLYNQQGKVDAVDVTYPINSLHGGHVFVVEPEETQSVELCLATDCKDIERYEIYVTYVGPAMEP